MKASKGLIRSISIFFIITENLSLMQMF